MHYFYQLIAKYFLSEHNKIFWCILQKRRKLNSYSDSIQLLKIMSNTKKGKKNFSSQMGENNMNLVSSAQNIFDKSYLISIILSITLAFKIRNTFVIEILKTLPNLG